MISNASSFIELSAGLNLATASFEGFAKDLLKNLAPDIEEEIKKTEERIFDHLSLPHGDSALYEIAYNALLKSIVAKGDFDNSKRQVESTRNFGAASTMAVFHCFFCLVLAAYEVCDILPVSTSFIICYLIFFLLFQIWIFEMETDISIRFKISGIPFAYAILILLALIFSIITSSLYEGIEEQFSSFITGLVMLCAVFHFIIYIIKVYLDLPRLYKLQNNLDNIWLDTEKKIRAKFDQKELMQFTIELYQMKQRHGETGENRQ